MHHDRAHAGLAAQPLGRRDDALEHRRVEGVVLVRPGQPHLGDVLVDVDRYALLAHGAQVIPARGRPATWQLAPRRRARRVASAAVPTPEITSEQDPRRRDHDPAS